MGAAGATGRAGAGVWGGSLFPLGHCVGGGARPTAMSLCPGEKGRRVLRSHLSSSSARKLNTHSSYHDVAAQHWRCAHSAYRAHCFPCWHTAANCSTKTNDLR